MRIKTEYDRRQVKQLALEAFWLWRATGQREEADKEIRWTNYHLKRRYSHRSAVRYARRMSEKTSTHILIGDNLHPALRWWLTATSQQRVGWLSRMLPRYLAANGGKNALPKQSRAREWVDMINGLGVAGRNIRLVKLNMIKHQSDSVPLDVILLGTKATTVITIQGRLFVHRLCDELESILLID